jgi:curved DNA-binding protein
MEFKDYYKTLGVSRTATDDEIKKAFRKLAREYHPDVAKDKKVAEEKFKEVNEAYEVLSEPDKRKKYDRLGANWKQGGFRPQPGYHQQTWRGGGPGEQEFEFHFGGTGFSDFFEQFFGGGRREGAGSAGFGGGPEEETIFGRAQTRARRGNDIEGDLLVTMHEALNGSVRSVSLRHADPKTGKAETTTLRVRVPAGVQEGQRIRVAGKGGHGLNGGPPGDLFLRVRLAKHPDLRLQGTNIYYDLELAPWEAVLGTTVKVPTLEGEVSLKVPPGSNQGHKLRLRGKGMPTGAGNRGDFFAVVTIQVPTQLSDEEKALWEKLASAATFNPRK